MRTRFFFIILVVLLVVAFGTTTLHLAFLKRERLELIDQQVRDTAVALLDSELGEPRKFELRGVEQIISEELGENRIGKFFIIRNGAGKILFRSASAAGLPRRKIPQTPQWITLETKRQYIRVLNLALPSIQDRTLQVGLVIDHALVSPSYFSVTNLGFVALTLALGLIVAWVLAAFLVRPISNLSDFIKNSATSPDIGHRLPELPAKLKTNSQDELAQLTNSFERLIERVNRGYDASRFWSYQMAHELKTPMAVVEALVSQGVHERKLAPELSEKVLDEVFDVSETISSFLSWAEIESSPVPKRQHVVKPSRILSSISSRLVQVYGDRITINIQEDFSILGNLQQLEQVLANLVQNACAYSPEGSKVLIECSNQTISIIDFGPGIPASVVKKLGEPFNRGEPSSNQRSTGLGLAYVQSVCWLHGWKLNVKTGSSGTRIDIIFPLVSEEAEIAV